MTDIKLKHSLHNFFDRHFSGETLNYHQIIAIFLPVLFDQGFVICMNLVNTAMISSSGVAAVSAVNMVDSLNMFLVNVFIAVSTGGTVVVAQYKGSGNDRMLSKAAAGSITSVFFMALAISLVIMSLHAPVLGLLFGRAEADVFANAKIYLIGSCLSYCGIAAEEAVCGALRGVGDTKSSLALSFIMNLTYVMLNFVFINTLHMGILGMVISINIARYFAALCAIIYLFRLNLTLHFHKRDLLRFNPEMLKKIFFIGIPFAAEQMFFNGGKILTQTFIVSLGTLAMATNAICASMAGLFQIPANALSLTIVTVVGQCIGNNNVNDAKKFIRSFLVLASFSFLMTSAIIMPLFQPIVSIFHAPARVIPDIFFIMCVNAAAQFLVWPISFLTPSALRAAGDSRYTSIVAMLSMWLFRVVLGYILGIVLHFGIVGVWFAMDCEWGVRGAIFFRRFMGRKWYRHRLVE